MSAQNILKTLGFNDKEITIYITLLKNGKATPSSLSRLTRINRATVYSVAKSLTAQGVIAEDLSGKNLYFIPLPLSSLEQLVERPRRELQEKELLIKKAIDELSLMSAPESYPVPKIRFIQEDVLKDFLYGNIRKWQQAALEGDGIVWGFQDESFADAYKHWIAFGWQTKESKDKRYEVRHLTNISSFEKGMKKHANRKIKLLTDIDFTSTIWVAGDYLAMVVTKQHPFYLVEIHDKTLAHNMREVLKSLWLKEC